MIRSKLNDNQCSSSNNASWTAPQINTVKHRLHDTTGC